MRRRPALALLAAALSAIGVGFAAADEIVPAEKRIIPYYAALPACEDASVLETVSSRFASKESSFWNSALTIVEYERVQATAYRPWGLDLIPRRFCSALATVSDGTRHRVDYSVREDLNFLGTSWGIEMCVQGLDRNWAYNPGCRMARP